MGCFRQSRNNIAAGSLETRAKKKGGTVSSFATSGLLLCFVIALVFAKSGVIGFSRS
jgi:hypothetical protein